MKENPTYNQNIFEYKRNEERGRSWGKNGCEVDDHRINKGHGPEKIIKNVLIAHSHDPKEKSKVTGRIKLNLPQRNNHWNEKITQL